MPRARLFCAETMPVILSLSVDWGKAGMIAPPLLVGGSGGAWSEVLSAKL
jgi:hypothetical protein